MIIELAGATHTTECTEEGTTVAGAGAGGLVVWLFIIPGGWGRGRGHFCIFGGGGEGCVCGEVRFLCVCVFGGKECGGRRQGASLFYQLECLKPNSSIILEINFLLMFMFLNRVCLFQG